MFSQITLSFVNPYTQYCSYFNFKYRLCEGKEVDEENFGAALVAFEYKYTYDKSSWKSNKQICIFTCAICSHKFEFEDRDYEKAKAHLTVHSNAQILLSSNNLVVYVFKSALMTAANRKQNIRILYNIYDSGVSVFFKNL